MRTRRSRKQGKGFTLLEVLLVLAILVILGSTVTFYFAQTQTKAYVRTAKIQINSLEQMLDQYRIDVGSYPSAQQGLVALQEAPSELANSDKWGGPYLKEAIPLDPWDNPYQYDRPSADEVKIWSWGPDGQDGSGDEVSNI